MFRITGGNLLLPRISGDMACLCFCQHACGGNWLGSSFAYLTIVIQNAVPEQDFGSVTGFSQFFAPLADRRRGCFWHFNAFLV